MFYYFLYLVFIFAKSQRFFVFLFVFCFLFLFLFFMRSRMTDANLNLSQLLPGSVVRGRVLGAPLHRRLRRPSRLRAPFEGIGQRHESAEEGDDGERDWVSLYTRLCVHVSGRKNMCTCIYGVSICVYFLMRTGDRSRGRTLVQRGDRLRFLRAPTSRPPCVSTHSLTHSLTN